jgi:hypothetical protein
VGSGSSNSSGRRLISFDMNVVASNGGVPPSYTQGTNTCSLTCHNAVHNVDGTVTINRALVKK